MGVFLTAKAEIEQTNKDGIWRTSHNQLYMDNDGQIYLGPRNFLTDGFTIPTPVALLAGEKLEWDLRPSIGHDLECQYHQEILVKFSYEELISYGYLRDHITEGGETIQICENIPAQYLELRPTTFKSTNAKFYRMMQATKAIKQWRAKMMFLGVHLNIGWLSSGKKPFDLDNIYKYTSP